MRHPPSAYQVSSIGRDPAALEAFYREHVETMLRYATRRTHDPGAAADLVSEVFLAAVHAADGYREELGTPVGWLHGIARNVAAAETRRAARAAAAEARIAGHRLLNSDDIGRLEERIDAERSARSLLADIAQLPASERAILELVAVDGLTLADASAVLGIKPTAARVRLYRARRRLRRTPAEQPLPADPAAPSLTTCQETS
ncbi:RNA polymerase sigma factor [Streptomyces sp. NBC_00079]|uniref:RNA polymerase sigma factor n=1 Tax=Streptomyces sp. NBC_00079 TaxID=2975644 RepID=UPI00324A5009